MTGVVTFLQSIPDVIWSGLLASFLTLGGVLLSNGSNTKRLRMQLDHDSSEKATERIGALRRGVYLDAAEQLVLAQRHLASLPQLDLRKVDASADLKGLFRAAAQLQLVAEPGTAVLVNRLMGAFAELTGVVLSSIGPLQVAKSDIETQGEAFKRAQAEVDRVVSERMKIAESGVRNDSAFDALQRSFEGHSARAAECAAAQAEAWGRYNALLRPFYAQYFERAPAVQKQTGVLLVQLRKDLGLDGDMEPFLRQMELQAEQMKAHVEKAFAPAG